VDHSAAVPPATNGIVGAVREEADHEEKRSTPTGYRGTEQPIQCGLCTLARTCPVVETADGDSDPEPGHHKEVA
jgi:hypothetical protein